MVARGKRVPGTKGHGKLLPHTRGELWTTVRQNVQRDPMLVENMLHQELGRLESRGEFSEGNKVAGLRETISHSENSGHTLGGG